ncbi:DUF3558 domain-containing protein [Saccharopolyspora pogona]|uniref:DUF3558 domain-containing protein n=1 Tax=Saccharopolyspora pogona TaxID=333966 RepID=UPI001689E8D6|nr:DUF3558 domain-containing protein [Saccharopolyspora pogona]
MNTTRTTLAAAASLFVLGLAGCSSPTPGLPEPTTGGETTSAVNDPFRIDQPKNLKAISDPCQLLNPQQLQEVGATTTGRQDKSQWGQANCAWDGAKLALQVSPDTVQGQGLRYTTKIVADGKPTAEVAGYPATHVGATSGSCGTYVSTSDTELFLVDFQMGTEDFKESGFSGPCAAADKIAEMVIKNLPPA